ATGGLHVLLLVGGLVVQHGQQLNAEQAGGEGGGPQAQGEQDARVLAQDGSQLAGHVGGAADGDAQGEQVGGGANDNGAGDQGGDGAAEHQVEVGQLHLGLLG